MYIKKIKIENFRSITELELELDNLNIFYGLNDAGKSNVLKALNLFFNNNTDYNKPYDFDTDFCQYTLAAIKARKKAPEIKIELTLAYYVDNSEFIWTKVWRDNGIKTDVVGDIFDEHKNRREKSKHESWARNLIYRYVPAMKDNIYFSTLLTEFYNVFSMSMSNELKKASRSFVDIIDDKTKPLSESLKGFLDMDTKISLPSNLSNLFSALDFSTKNRNGEYISLNNRGDGIKVRHVAIILKFFAEEQNNLKRKGSTSINTIWGYEEPENNLELKAAIEKSEEFKAYSDFIQILLTTHSPAFYRLKDYNSTKLYRAIGNDKGSNYIKVKKTDELYQSDQGLLAIISPIIEDKINEINKFKSQLKEMEAKNFFDKNIVFVEGESDKIILDYLFSAKYPSLNVAVIDCGGSNQTKNNLISWLYNPKVENIEHKYFALALFDDDEPGRKSKKELDEAKKVFKSYKQSKGMSVSLKNPIHLSNVKELLGDSYFFEIEEMFESSIWNHARDKNWLEERSLDEFSSSNLMKKLEDSIKDCLEENLKENELIYVYHKVKDKKKKKFAQYVIQQDISYFHELEKTLKPFIDKISNQSTTGGDSQ